MEREERPFARRLALWIVNRLGGPVVDLGAGTGVYVDELRKQGCRAQGYDIADPQPWPDLVRTQSMLEVTDPQPVVLCLETAEHLPDDQAPAVIEAVWRNCRPGGWVIWSAAQPGQGGVGHINCQPPAYWHDLAMEQGFRRDWDQEQNVDNWILGGYHMGWFRNNRQIWHRPQ